MTDQELQLLLVNKLSEKLILKQKQILWKSFLNNSEMEKLCKVKSTEWLEIVRSVENNLTPEQEVLCVECLAALIMDDAYEDCPRYNKSELCARDQIYRSSWQQRATALHQIGVI